MYNLYTFSLLALHWYNVYSVSTIVHIYFKINISIFGVLKFTKGHSSITTHSEGHQYFESLKYK